MQHLSNCGGGQAEAEVESEAHTEAEAETKKRQRQRQKQRHRQTQGQRLRASHCGGTLEMYEKRIRPPQKYNCKNYAKIKSVLEFRLLFWL
jgi:xanthine/CO dehydrogenase XdhC/CoxF family maturation factor